MRSASLCKGYGGLDLAVADVLEVDEVWCAEFDAHASAVIAHHWPDLPNLGDITAIDWKETDTMSKHQLAQEMYDRYCQGLSIEQVAVEFDRSRQSVWKMFDRRGWDLRPRPPARPYVEHAGRRFTIGAQGYYRATDGDRELLHRLVWIEAHGPIPDGCDIHHRDHDKTNNDPDNLECLTKAEHTRRHAREVVPTDSPAIDVITAGYP